MKDKRRYIGFFTVGNTNVRVVCDCQSIRFVIRVCKEKFVQAYCENCGKDVSDDVADVLKPHEIKEGMLV